MKKQKIYINTKSYEQTEEEIKNATNSILKYGKQIVTIKRQDNEIVKLKKSLFYDTLTSCYTRRWLEDEYLKDRCKFKKTGHAVLIDLDNFKIINDTYGHNTGDDVLKFIAHQLIELETGEGNKTRVVRIGGDEFLLLLEKYELGDDIEDVAESILEFKEKIIKKFFTTEDGFTIKVVFSFGIAKIEVGSEYKNVLEVADKNMYLNKKKNKKK